MSPRTNLGRVTVAAALLGFAACVQQPTDIPERDPGAPVGTATQALTPPALSVKVANTDQRFDGNYYITGATHKYGHSSSGSGGYQTVLRLCRNAET